MIITTDLDSTLTKGTDEWSPEFWKKREPDLEYIQLLKKAKSQGHKIIIHTSRLSSEALHGTIEWLEKFEVPYDALHLDKPFTDVTIDDKMITKAQLAKMLEKETVTNEVKP